MGSADRAVGVSCCRCCCIVGAAAGPENRWDLCGDRVLRGGAVEPLGADGCGARVAGVVRGALLIRGAQRRALSVEARSGGDRQDAAPLDDSEVQAAAPGAASRHRPLTHLMSGWSSKGPAVWRGLCCG